MRHRAANTKASRGIIFGVDKDPKGGWRAWWRCEVAVAWPVTIHECATYWGARYAAWRGARRLAGRLAGVQQSRKDNGYA